jgi:hypothetical protein
MTVEQYNNRLAIGSLIFTVVALIAIFIYMSLQPPAFPW